MKYLLYIIVGLAAVTLFYFGIFNREQPQPSNNPLRQSDSEASQQTEQPVNTAQGNWETKVDDQLAVTVTVTPIDISPQSKEWKFDIVMDTHSVELDQDLTKSAILIDDQGKEYKPFNWEGPVGGHHREGVLTFNQIMPTPKSVVMKISGIGDVVRSFTWQLLNKNI